MARKNCMTKYDDLVKLYYFENGFVKAKKRKNIVSRATVVTQDGSKLLVNTRRAAYMIHNKCDLSTDDYIHCRDRDDTNLSQDNLFLTKKHG